MADALRLVSHSRNLSRTHFSHTSRWLAFSTMGRANGAKLKIPGAKNQLVKTFFATGDPKTPSPPRPAPGSNMVATDEQAFQGEVERADNITRSEIIDILEASENRFAQTVESLLHPIQTQLQDLKNSLQSVS